MFFFLGVHPFIFSIDCVSGCRATSAHVWCILLDSSLARGSVSARIFYHAYVRPFVEDRRLGVFPVEMSRNL